VKPLSCVTEATLGLSFWPDYTGKQVGCICFLGENATESSGPGLVPNYVSLTVPIFILADKVISPRPLIWFVPLVEPSRLCMAAFCAGEHAEWEVYPARSAAINTSPNLPIRPLTVPNDLPLVLPLVLAQSWQGQALPGSVKLSRAA